MKIIQISDLHINEDTNLHDETNIINILFDSIKHQLTLEETNLIIFCGDLFNQGKNSQKENINSLLLHFKNVFTNYIFEFLFVPGNHDLINNSFDDFNETILNFNSNNCFDSYGILLKEIDELNIILMNTTFHKDHKFGQINYEALEETLNHINNKPTILVGHHSLISRYPNDSSNIREANKLIQILKKFPNIISYIHGHTHSYDDLTIGNNCKVVGVGPYHINSLEVPRQFNFLDIKAGNINSISSFRYSSDFETFSENPVYKRANFNMFKGNSFTNIHDSIVKTTKLYNCIHNLNLSYSNLFSELEHEVITHYSKDLNLAKLWQQPEQPEELYYNHGQYMKDENKDGINFVIEELKRKATSSRALISLISLKMILYSGDNFLPSFDLIQFGFKEESKETLYVTLYLRALEVNHFLKINFCELYLLIKKIKEHILSLKNVNINIIAFKAQYKENYGCFQKPKLDLLSEAALSIIFQNNPNKIKALLEEKLAFSETVIENKGIISLCNILNALVQYHQTTPQFTLPVLQELQVHLEKLKDLYIKIADLRNRTSDYQKIKKLENQINTQIKIIIKFLE
ncbi:metallophosphoesterase family protein [Cetobacterium sp.]|uniref:metallophosphoesterase family protein n=1 Tax=Cetobacterium sp. TaxID=2071632 RepID=UPI003F40EA48